MKQAIPPSAAEARSPAEVYDQLFVPALFRHWGEVVCEAAGVAPGQRVLDVACGTGALTLVAAERVAAGGSVVGLDANEEMLDVARRKDFPVQWHHGRAESLPFADDWFDAVVSQFGLMFFEDRVAALAEMRRVLRLGGQLAVAVCDALDHSPGYSVLTELLHRLFGEPVAAAFRAPFQCGDRQLLLDLAEQAGIAGARVERHDGAVRFDSIRSLVAAERSCAWTLGGLLDEAQFRRLSREAEESLNPFVNGRGEVELGMPALILTGRRSG